MHLFTEKLRELDISRRYANVCVGPLACGGLAMSDGFVLPAQLFLTLLTLLRMVMRFYPDVWRLTSQFNEFSLPVYLHVLLVEANCLFRCKLYVVGTTFGVEFVVRRTSR